MTIKDYAIKAFKEGSDNFGETVTGEVGELQYVKALKQYLVPVLLKDSNGFVCSSEVGFKANSAGKYDVISGHKVFEVIPTPAMEEEFLKAIQTEL